MKQILKLLWKMVENMFFLDSEHVGMKGNPPAPSKIYYLLLTGGKQVQVRRIHPNPLHPQSISVHIYC